MFRVAEVSKLREQAACFMLPLPSFLGPPSPVLLASSLPPLPSFLPTPLSFGPSLSLLLFFFLRWTYYVVCGHSGNGSSIKSLLLFLTTGFKKRKERIRITWGQFPKISQYPLSPGVTDTILTHCCPGWRQPPACHTCSSCAPISRGRGRNVRVSQRCGTTCGGDCPRQTQLRGPQTFRGQFQWFF